MSALPRIAVVWPTGSEDRPGLGQFYLRGFRKLGHEAIGAATLTRDIWSLRGRLQETKAGRKNFMTQRVAELRAEFNRRDVAMVMVIKGEELDPEHIAGLRPRAGVPLVLYHPDSPIWKTRPHFDSEFVAGLREYDLVVTFAKVFVPVYRQLGCKRVERLPFAYDPTVHRPVQLQADDRAHYLSDVSYAGTVGPLQRYWVDQLQRFAPRTYGPGWERLPRVMRYLRKVLSYKRYMGMVKGYGNDMNKVCAGAKVVFNMVRAEAECAHSMKTFELPASGGCVVTNRTEEQLEFFPEGCAYFDDRDELVAVVERLLGDEAARKKLVEQGRREAEPHTYERRAAELRSMLQL